MVKKNRCRCHFCLDAVRCQVVFISIRHAPALISQSFSEFWIGNGAFYGLGFARHFVKIWEHELPKHWHGGVNALPFGTQIFLSHSDANLRMANFKSKAPGVLIV